MKVQQLAQKGHGVGIGGSMAITDFQSGGVVVQLALRK